MQQPQYITRQLRNALRLSGLIVLYVALAHVLTEPVHALGREQEWLRFVNGLASLLAFPGDQMMQGLSRDPLYGIGGWRWLGSLGVNFAFYVAVFCPLFALFERRLPPGTPQAPLSARRTFLRRSVRAGLSCGTTCLGYGMLAESRRLTVCRHAVSLRDLPPSLEGLRIAHLTDIHHGPWLSVDYVRNVVRTTNALRPDVIVLTGDNVDHEPVYVEPVARELSQLRARIGVVGVLGNHDWSAGAELMREQFHRFGIPLIDNARLMVTPDRSLVNEADQGLCFAGLGDLWEDHQHYRPTLGGLPPRMPVLLLSHNPDTAEERPFVRFLREGHARVDLMLSGHTHGGQVRLPLLGAPIIPSRYGQKYAEGFVQGPACPVFVSRGIGMAGLPLRFCVPPEIAVLELRRA